MATSERSSALPNFLGRAKKPSRSRGASQRSKLARFHLTELITGGSKSTPYTKDEWLAMWDCCSILRETLRSRSPFIATTQDGGRGLAALDESCPECGRTRNTDTMRPCTRCGITYGEVQP